MWKFGFILIFILLNSVSYRNSLRLEAVPKKDAICGALRDLVAFVQFKKREKHPWRSVNFSKVATCNFTKINAPPWVFFTFLT